MDHQYVACSILANKVFEDFTKLGLKTYIAQEEAALDKLVKSRDIMAKDTESTHIQTQEEINAIACLLSGLLDVVKGFLQANSKSSTCMAVVETLESKYWCHETRHFKPPTNLTAPAKSAVETAILTFVLFLRSRAAEMETTQSSESQDDLRKITERLSYAINRGETSAAINDKITFGSAKFSHEGLVCEILSKSGSGLAGELCLKLLETVAVSDGLKQLLAAINSVKRKRQQAIHKEAMIEKAIIEKQQKIEINRLMLEEDDKHAKDYQSSQSENVVAGRTDFCFSKIKTQASNVTNNDENKRPEVFNLGQKGTDQISDRLQPMLEETIFSRREDFFQKFINLKINKPEKVPEVRSSKPSSKASINLSIIKQKANKLNEPKSFNKQQPCRRVLSNVISSKLVTKPQNFKHTSQYQTGSSWSAKPRGQLSWLGEQPSTTEDYLLNFMNMDESDYLCCPDSPNRESTQSGSQWVAANKLVIEMPSPANETQSVTQEVLTPIRKFNFESKTPEKVLPKGVFKNTTNFSRDKSGLKALSKSKRSFGKESSTKLSAVKFGRVTEFNCGVQKIKHWDSDIIAFGTPMKEDFEFYECPEHLKL